VEKMMNVNVVGYPASHNYHHQGVYGSGLDVGAVDCPGVSEDRDSYEEDTLPVQAVVGVEGSNQTRKVGRNFGRSGSDGKGGIDLIG
jgi:hypothetical protein